jgi:hypothetical protein
MVSFEIRCFHYRFLNVSVHTFIKPYTVKELNGCEYENKHLQ